MSRAKRVRQGYRDYPRVLDTRIAENRRHSLQQPRVEIRPRPLKGSGTSLLLVAMSPDSHWPQPGRRDDEMTVHSHLRYRNHLPGIGVQACRSRQTPPFPGRSVPVAQAHRWTPCHEDARRPIPGALAGALSTSRLPHFGRDGSL